MGRLGRRFTHSSVRPLFEPMMHAELVTAGMEPEAAVALREAAQAAGQTIEERVAWNAYNVADAMCAEMEKRRG